MFILLPCPQTGATAPFPLAGTVVDFNVENLAAITIIQTLWPGTPLHYHHVAMGFDMRTALSSLGGPEKALLAVAGADMGSFYGLSCGCAGSATDSAAYDIQNGAETMAQLLLTVGSRANLITGIGSLGNAMATSQEQILFDCELISVADYLRKGIQVDEERLAFAAFARLGPGGDFLSDELTLKLLRSGEHFPAASLQRAGVTAKQTMYEALHNRAQEILRTHRPAVPEDRIEDLRRYIVARQPAIEESLS
jgi:trimethylamine--corrinoid protein Co-methyltransferase